MNVGRCKECGATVIWSVTVSGSKIPLNLIPIRVAVGDVDSPVMIREVHEIHFTTCIKKTGQVPERKTCNGTFSRKT